MLHGASVITLLIIAFVVGMTVLNRLLNLKARHVIKRKRYDFRAMFKKKWNVEELSRRLDIPVTQLLQTPTNYRRCKIPKRRGGMRQLLIPNDQLKSIQRRINKRLLKKLRTHDCAIGYEPGFTIVHNALFHSDMAVVIKMDIKDFFPNTTADRIERYFRHIGWDKKASALLTELVTHDHTLPQGAPTSPRLSNLVNCQMDTHLDLVAKHFRGGYSRYADDITISFPEDYPTHVRGTVQRVARCVKKFGYQINHRKTQICRQHQQQKVTGLVVNTKVNLPREKRRWLRAVEHRLQTQGQASLTQEQLDGYKALQQMITSQTHPKT